MDRQEIEKRIKELERQIKEFRFSNIHQQNIASDSVKSRHVGEGVRYLRAGTAADRPSSGEKAGAIWFSTDSFVLSIYTGSAWKTVTLS